LVGRVIIRHMGGTPLAGRHGIWGHLTARLDKQVFDYELTKDLIPSFATFARHLEAVSSRGLPRDYRVSEERLHRIRGRVNLPAQQRLAGRPLPFECRFDEYTAGIPINRILRSAPPLDSTGRVIVTTNTGAAGARPTTRRGIHGHF
jgi:McrBC 5-methylcytosine restriction system component